MADPGRLRAWKRNLTIDPFCIPAPIVGPPNPLKIGSDFLRSRGVTSYTMQNPNLFWIWYRGWVGEKSAMTVPFMLGHLIAPGGEHLRESQTPDWIVALPWSRPAWPLAKPDGTAIQSNAETMLIYTLGSGGI